MTIKAGDRLPDAKLVKMTSEGPKTLTTKEIFGGKKVALFAVPGAYTPTCSAKHLPGYVQNAGELRKKGIDEVVCVSVNDAFVMGAWGKDQKAEGKVTLLADGNGDFTKALGLDLDARGFGMGTRSKRYSMIVDDGVVKKLNVEAPSEFKVSSAEFMMSQL